MLIVQFLAFATNLGELNLSTGLTEGLLPILSILVQQALLDDLRQTFDQGLGLVIETAERANRSVLSQREQNAKQKWRLKNGLSRPPRTSIRFIPGFRLRISLRTLNLLASGKETSLRSTRAGLTGSAGLAG